MRSSLAFFVLACSFGLSLASPVAGRTEHGAVAVNKPNAAAAKPINASAHRRNSAAASRAKRLALSHRGAEEHHVAERGIMEDVAELEKRDALDIDAIIGLLTQSRDGFVGSQKRIHSYRTRAQKYKSSRSSGEFKSQVANELKAWRAQFPKIPALSSIDDSLKPFGRDKGLHNYNKYDEVQRLLKSIVDAVKYTLNDVNVIVYEIPVLGPILGPIVYDIKCIIDDVVNGVENTVDGLLNSLGISLFSPFNGLSTEFLSSTCKFSPSSQVC